MKEILLLIILIMMFYDFSLHLLRLLFGLEKARRLKYYWSTFLINNKNRYNLFWTIYWGIAFLLLLLFLIL